MNKVSNAEKVKQPDLPVIDPILYELGMGAIFYGIEWAGTIEIDDKVGYYRSNHNSRPFAKKWKKYLNDFAELEDSSNAIGMRERWTGKSYYFSSEEGNKAYEDYKKDVLEGWVKPDSRTWSNRFEKETNTTYEMLAVEYPELYAKKVVIKKPKEVVEQYPNVLGLSSDEEAVRLVNETPEDAPMGDVTELEEGPSPEDLLEEELVANALATEPLTSMDQFEDIENGVRVIILSGVPTHQRVSEDIIVERLDDNRDHEYVRVYVEELDKTLRLEEGEWEINGVKISVKIERE